MHERPLPRLLYLADVPVEATYHGSALIYRLLQRYPAERLMIVEGNLFRPASDRRLPGVPYAALTVGYPRLLRTRLHSRYSGWLLRRAARRAGGVRQHLGTFAPQAVLTVAHGYTWLTAARFAEVDGLPLHLIVHDDWPRSGPAPSRHEAEFGRVYRGAASRLCVSPYMAEEYERRYGAAGTVLLPARAHDAPRFTAPAARLRRPDGSPMFVFAGTINSPGYARLLAQVAHHLGAHGGILSIYGPLTAQQAATLGLTAPNIRICGLLTSEQLLERLRADADVLLVPMSFADADRSNMRMSFPSKLTDYTAVGLPLMICGPDDCSAVRWAQANPGVAEVVTSNGDDAVRDAVDRLAGDGEYRLALAANALAVGERDFSAATADSILHAALVA
jgi:glycosyltransferase involved in cell wall biosynthesis